MVICGQQYCASTCKMAGIFASLVTPCFEIEINELRVAGVVTKPIVALPLAFHIMKL